jgi:cyclopropane-fatty-acyl-phospholipid synthase
MADRTQINATYNYMDELFRLSMGEYGDITAAMYNGDFSKSLASAQADKHDYILQGIRFAPGHRILDIGCGWGGLLDAIRERGGQGVGLTLSSAQEQSCKQKGLDVRPVDWKELDPNQFGQFDGVASVGAFEHFCSEEEYYAGRQVEIYRNFFRLCADLLPSQGRLYLQTMLFGPALPPWNTVTLDAPRDSDVRVLAILRKFYPGSFLPESVDQIREAAAPSFRIVSLNNGRLDYIETLTQWGLRLKKFSWKKALAAARTSRYFFTDPDFRYKMELLRGSYNLEAFRRELFDHQRIILEKVEG